MHTYDTSELASSYSKKYTLINIIIISKLSILITTPISI